MAYIIDGQEVAEEEFRYMKSCYGYEYSKDSEHEYLNLSRKVIARNAVKELKLWFDTYYSQHEQKYRRLIALNKKDDDDVDAQFKLTALYELAEKNRKEIQKLEKEIGGSDATR